MEDNILQDMKRVFAINPFIGYKDRIAQKIENANLGQKLNPVHEIVNNYYMMNGMDGKPKMFYEGRYSYGRLAKQAKMLLESCDGDLEDALWCLDKMKYLAERNRFDWTISTCLKHELRWGK